MSNLNEAIGKRERPTAIYSEREPRGFSAQQAAVLMPKLPKMRRLPEMRDFQLCVAACAHPLPNESRFGALVQALQHTLPAEPDNTPPPCVHRNPAAPMRTPPRAAAVPVCAATTRRASRSSTSRSTSSRWAAQTDHWSDPCPGRVHNVRLTPSRPPCPSVPSRLSERFSGRALEAHRAGRQHRRGGAARRRAALARGGDGAQGAARRGLPGVEPDRLQPLHPRGRALRAQRRGEDGQGGALAARTLAGRAVCACCTGSAGTGGFRLVAPAHDPSV